MIFVAGPPGGGKSSALSIKKLGIDWFNADDRAAELNAGSYHKISPAIRETVGRELERFILSHIDARRDLAFETTLRSAITFDQTKLAHANGFQITMVYVAAGPVEEHIRRVANRADLGQHSASETKIRAIYEESMGNLVTAFQESEGGRIDFLRIFDNSRLWQPPRVILETRGGEVRYLDQDIPEWVETTLRGSDFNIAAIRKALSSKGRVR
jgi:predicted ABC-type ATPase